MDDELFLSRMINDSEYDNTFIISDINEVDISGAGDAIEAYSFTATLPSQEEGGSIVNQWVVKKTANGFEYTITDGANEDIIFVDNQYNLYLDGNPIMVEFDEEDENLPVERKK